MGLRASISGGLTALGVVLAASAAQAQQTVPATNQATPAPTPTPTPTPGTVGPPELQNFNLDGTVTRTPTPAPAPATSAPAPSSSAPAASAPAPRRDAPSAAAATRDTTAPATERAAAPSDVAPAPSSPVAEAPIAEAPVASGQADLMPPAPVEPAGGSLWPWLAALAVALAAGGAWWLRRQRGEAEELSFAGHAPVAEPQPAPMPVPAPRAPAPKPHLEGGIVSRALQPKLMFELKPLKFETDDKHNARLTFELVVVNVGGAPARDIRIEAKMFNAGPEQDRQIVSFFRAPGALGAKLPPIGPQDRVPLRSRIGMPANDYQALDLGGKSLVVPMIAVNALYRGSGGEAHQSASWLVGALPSGGEAEKLRPFPLDRPVATTALAARMHSAGLNG